MKERLRGVLRVTKDSLAMITSLSELPDNLKETMVIQHERTLVLSPNVPKQFMHLRHNRTGSESIDGWLRCAIDRQNDILSLNGDGNNGTALSIDYGAIAEGDNLESCLDNLAERMGAALVDDEFYYHDQEGNLTTHKFDPNSKKLNIPDDIRNACGTSMANVMSYGASLRAVRNFGWRGVDSIAMFANPVERTLRMYQLLAEQCYGCRELKDVLKDIKGGIFGRDHDSARGTYEHHEYCAVQLVGHQATQLLSSASLYKVANDVRFENEKEIVEEAVRNLREEITWIGVDSIEDSVDGFKEIFPWLSENLNEAALKFEQEFVKLGDRIGDDAGFGLPEDYVDEESCVFQNANQDHYTCGTREVDEETLHWIEQLNMRDLAVYKAARERFLVQQEVIQEYRDALGR